MFWPKLSKAAADLVADIVAMACVAALLAIAIVPAVEAFSL